MTFKVSTGPVYFLLSCTVFLSQVQTQWVYTTVDEVPEEDMNKVERVALIGPEDIDIDIDDAPGLIVPFDDAMHKVKRYFWRAPWMSVPFPQKRNYKRDVMAPPLHLQQAAAERYPWIRMSVNNPVKRSGKKMDGRMRILKHI